MLFFDVFLRESSRTAAKRRTNLSTNSGKATKLLGRLAPNLAHMCKFIWEWMYSKQIAPRDIRGHLGVLGGQQVKRMGKLSDWHQLWFTSADSYGNGHRLNTSRPSIPQGTFRGGGGVGGHKFKSPGKLSNGWTDWHRIWYTWADSSGNGHRLNTIHPTIPQGHFGFVYGSTNSNVWGSCQTAGPIGSKFGTNLRIRLGMDIG